MAGDLLAGAPNLPAIVLGFVFTVIFAMHAPKEANWLPGTVRMHIVGAALSCAFVLSLAIMLDTESAAFALGWYGTIVVVIMFYGYVVLRPYRIAQNVFMVSPYVGS